MAANTPLFKAPSIEVPAEDSSPALNRLLDTLSPRARKLSKIGLAEVCPINLQSTLLLTLAERPLAVFPCRLSFGRATPALDCCLSLCGISFKLLCIIHDRSWVFYANGATRLCLDSHCSLCCSANLHLRLLFIASTRHTRQRVLS